MLTNADIELYCGQRNYDLRVSGNGRWIDQKCAADVVTAIADFILNYYLERPEIEFETRDIWHSDYAIENVAAIFRKPRVDEMAARNEYDKFFQQPMEMLAYSGVLSKRKQGNRNIYKVESSRILEHIAMRERNALQFLCIYIESTLRDSGIYPLFEFFFNNQNKNTFADMKKGYSDFIINNTRINKKLECDRIFIKVLNPLAFNKHSCGTERGSLSKDAITYDMLMYNRNNFRDIYANKPKGVTRSEYAEMHPTQVNLNYYEYQSNRAKRFLRRFNDENRNSITEYLDGSNETDPAVHIHHIFPKAEYPEICYYYENLIALTPTQHLSYAHPFGRTQEIEEQYQHLLLLAKTDRIKENLDDDRVPNIYEFINLIHVLSVGLDNNDVLDISDRDFPTVVNVINIHYGTEVLRVAEGNPNYRV